MKKLDTLLPIIKSELFLGVVTLVLVGVVCVAFQHLVIKKLSTPRTQAQPVHKVIIEGKQMTKNEKLAFDLEAATLDTEILPRKNTDHAIKSPAGD